MRKPFATLRIEYLFHNIFKQFVKRAFLITPLFRPSCPVTPLSAWKYANYLEPVYAPSLFHRKAVNY